MDENFRKVISKKLNNSGIAELYSEVVTEETEVKGEQIDANDVGTASDGTKYIKSLVMKYLNEKGYPLTQESVDLAAKMFQAKGDSYIQKNVKTVVHSDFDTVNDENVDTYLTLKITEMLAKIEMQNNIMDYKIDVVIDKYTGGTDFEALQKSLNWHSQRGWKVKSIFTNEIGKNSSSVTVGGYTSGTNATIDQTIIIYERSALMTDEDAMNMRKRK